MDFTTALICIAATTFAACYGWGMRGAVIGGEKGAMLPGAFIGLILAWFSGGAIMDFFWIPAAVGAMGMTFGGTETYGETIGMVLHRGRPDHNPKKGYTGLALKGALWFAVCGGFLGLSFAAMTGEIYKVRDFLILFLLVTPILRLGYEIFNKPYDRDKKVFPKIYFSLTRREEWGGNVVLIIALSVTAAIKCDWLTLMMTCFGFVFGAIGWLVAMKGYVLIALPLKSGRYLLEKLNKKGVVDGWKLMEFVLGAFGGFGLSLAFCLGFPKIAEYNEIINRNGIYSDETVVTVAPYAISLCILGILAINIYQFVCDRKGKKVDYFFWDRIERPLYSVIPMFFVVFGSVFASKVMTVFMLVFGCAMKCAFDRFDGAKLLPLGQAVVGTVCVAVYAGCFTDLYSPFTIVLVGTVPYMITEFASAVWADLQKGKKIGHLLTSTAFATVYPTFAVQCATILFLFYKIFAI